MEIGIFHFSMPPVIGGVERVIDAHARLFRKNGHRVYGYYTGNSGNTGRPTDCTADFPTISVPGCVEGNRSQIARFLGDQKIDLWIVHNILTMPFCLAATGAVWDLAQGNVPVVSWIHDLAAINPHYKIAWNETSDLLKKHPPKVRAVTISEQRRQEYADLTGHNDIQVIPNGVDFRSCMGLSESLSRRIPEAFPILFHPTRILRRKNIQLGLQVTAELRNSGHTPLYLISGAPERFSGDQMAYRRELDDLIAGLGISPNVIFLGDEALLSDTDVASLYRLADAVFFPSEQEGFGLPLIEGATHRVPIFCSEALPMAEFAQTFPPDIAPSALAVRIEAFLENDPASRLRKAALKEYDWDAIYHRHIAPFLEK